MLTLRRHICDKNNLTVSCFSLLDLLWFASCCYVITAASIFIKAVRNKGITMSVK